MNLCKTVERKSLLCLCYWLWVKPIFGLLPTQSLWSPTLLCEFDTDLDNSTVLAETWLSSGLIANTLHQFCSYFKQIFNIKLCQCKELCFSSVSQTIWHGWSHHFSSVPDTNPRFDQKAKEEIQCGVVDLGSPLGTSIKYRLQSSYPLTLCCAMVSFEWTHNCLTQSSRDYSASFSVHAALLIFFPYEFAFTYYWILAHGTRVWTPDCSAVF